jgi:surface antigen
VAKAEVAAISSNANIIITLGFNDCLGSCTWKSLNINAIATSYFNTLKEITEQNNNFKFYFCAVNPVDAACPGISYKGDLISTDILNKKIESFNKLIKEKCLDDGTAFYFDKKKEDNSKAKDKLNIVFIDSYDYFKSTSFNGRDGKYYSHETCLYMLDFVKSYIRIASGTAFRQRTEAPTKEDTYYYEDNVYYNGGWGMPNCTAYAWGRFFEILGSKPALSTGNAEDWYPNKSDGYERGDTPQVGAVMCWEGVGSEAGHVAIVEEVISSTEVKTSESGWQDSRFWWTSNRTKGSGNWGCGSGYVFQGFIYNPNAAGGGSAAASGDNVTKAQVTSSNEYLGYDKWIDGDPYNSIPGKEMKLNARYIWQYLGSRGWTLNAVAGILGNMETESHINPGMWQSGRVGGNPDRHGYSLVQWTPYTKYTNWCEKRDLDPADMDSALERIIWELENNQQYGKTSEYPLSFKEFSTSTKDAYWLGGAFLINYERPSEQYRDPVTRGNQAKRWFEYLLPFSPFMTAPMSLVNLKVDNYEPTKIKGSFVARNGEIGSCKLFKGKNKTSIANKNYTKKALTGIDDKEKEKKTASGDITKVLNFEFSKLIPGTEYRILVEISKADKSETIESEITFTTPQDYPESVSDIKLQIANNKFPNDEFKLTCDLNSYWGYWKKNGYGYDIQLLINGQCFAEKTLNTLNNEIIFTLNKFFNSYKSKLDDTIQIGIRTWVLTDKGKKIYNAEGVCASNSICKLKQPFITYLNVD